jgi:hypothetical protein
MFPGPVFKPKDRTDERRRSFTIGYRDDGIYNNPLFWGYGKDRDNGVHVSNAGLAPTLYRALNNRFQSV